MIYAIIAGIFLLCMNLLSQDFIYLEFSDGFKSIYKINDIVNIRTTKHNEEAGVYIHYRDSLNRGFKNASLNRINFSTDIFENSSLNLFLTNSKKSFNLTEVDSISFGIYLDPGVEGIDICGTIWMPQNLNVNYYQNGEPIYEAKTDLEWMDATSKRIGAWCYMYNDESYGEIFGVLYNWYAVNDPRGLAPAGWRMPTADEWDELISCAGGHGIAGGRIKQIGTFESKTGLWAQPNFGASNDFDFEALPGGWRYYSIGEFGYPGKFTAWWSSDEFDSNNAYFWVVRYDNPTMAKEKNSKGCGFSVRCVKE